MADRAPRAYVVHLPVRLDRDENRWVPAVNLQPAEYFGEITFILNDEGRPSSEPEDTIPRIREAMTEFKETDYLVLVGDPNLQIYAAAFALRTTGGKLNLLKWNPTQRKYNGLYVELWQDEVPLILRNLVEPEATVTRKSQVEFDERGNKRVRIL